jgi:DNA processing protein
VSEEVAGSQSALPPLNDQQLVDWLRLIRTETIGPTTFRLLVNRFGGAANALAALPELSKRGGRLVTPPSADKALAEIAALTRAGGRFLALGEPDYPQALRHVDAPPPLLAVIGNSSLLVRRTVSIVGSRDASALGRRFARDVAFELGAAGWVIASGLARGIDQAAHEGSIKTGTIAVLAGGLDKPYPPECLPLYERIRDEGAAISEMAMGHTPVARDFPRRNRIVAGVSFGVLVVEAALRSGSLITARLANEMGREVFAVPGHPLDLRAGGTNKLIRDGATMATGAADILEALEPMTTERLPRQNPVLFRNDAPELALEDPTPGARATILALLGPTPVELDDLIRESGEPAGVVQLVLVELELAGRLIRTGGSRIALLP